jgi:hypothetical protein
MIPRRIKSIPPLLVLVGYFLMTGGLLAAPTGPTLRFDYDKGKPIENPLNKFMYFVPLIWPAPISVTNNTGNTQRVRVVSSSCVTNGTSFHAVCEFDFVGDGFERNVFDHDDLIRQYAMELKAGKPLPIQLDFIGVQGSGKGLVEIKGTLAKGRPSVTEVRMQFDCHGYASPVSIILDNIIYRNGAIQHENELVARVNHVAFYRKSGLPKMAVSLSTIKPADDSDSLWQDFVGRVKGVVANMFIPALPVSNDGYQAMMDFGLALAMGHCTFTFPFAPNLKSSPVTAP